MGSILLYDLAIFAIGVVGGSILTYIFLSAYYADILAESAKRINFLESRKPQMVRMSDEVRLFRVLQNEFDIPCKNLDDNISAWLQDPFDVGDLKVVIEDEFGVYLNDEDWGQVETLRDILDMI